MPDFGGRDPAPSWLLAKATANERSIPITSPVERISGPKHRIDAGEAGEREHRFLDPDMIELVEREIERGERFAGHHPACDLGDRLADHLGDERHRARGARIDLEHVNHAILQRVLDVHQPADVERERQLLRLLLEPRHRLGAQRARRQRAGAVARMNARLLDVLHDPRHDDCLAVAESVDVDLDRVRQISIEQKRVLAENRVDLAGLIVRVARLDVGGHQARQDAEQIIVELGESWMIAIARPPST